LQASTEDKDDVIKESFYEEPEQVLDQLPRNHMKILLGDFNTKVGLGLLLMVSHIIR
jgi:hypothetical protein